MVKFTCISCILAVLLFAGCSKDSAPTEVPLVPGTSTIVTGTVKDSTGNPIDSAAIKIKYYFTAAAKQSAKESPCSLESFTAIRTSSGVQLQWVTLWESPLFYHAVGPVEPARAAVEISATECVLT